MPGGCTVIERTCGRRLRCRYAAVTEVSTGPSPFPVRTARHCRYRALGLVIGDPSTLEYAADQALHVPYGVSVLPHRVNSSIWLPVAADPCPLSVLDLHTVCA